MEAKKCVVVCFFAVLCFHLTVGLYEDQAGKFDWRHQYVGNVKFVKFDMSSQTGKRIIVGTEENVVAAISARSGQLAWRQILESDGPKEIDDMLLQGNYLVTVSGNGEYVRSFSPATGLLQWELYGERSNKHSAKLSIHGKTDDEVAIFAGGNLKVVSIERGEQLWNVELPNSDSVQYKYLSSQEEEELTVIGVVPSSHVTVSSFGQEGVKKGQRTVPAAWISQTSRCLVTGNQYLVCLDMRTNTLQTLKLKDGQAFKAHLLQDLGLSSQNPEIFELEGENVESEFGLRVSSSQTAVLSISGSSQLKLIKNVQGSAVQLIMQGNQKQLMALNRKDGDNVEVKVYDYATGGEIADQGQILTFPRHHGNPLQLYSFQFKKKDGSTGMRLLIFSEDYSIVLLQQTGKVIWTREEALSSVVAVEMVDLPVSQIQAEMEDEFGSKSGDIFSMFVKRFSTQFHQLKTYFIQLKNKLRVSKHHHHSESFEGDQSEDEEIDDEEYLTRDDFNLHKMLVTVTAAGKIYGLDSHNGKIIWRYYLPDLSPFKRFGHETIALFIQRTNAHFPHQPQCAVIGKHKVTGKALFYTFHPITGETVGNSPPGGKSLDFSVLQATLMAQIVDDHFMRPIVILDTDLKYHIFPETSSGLIKDVASSLFMFSTDVNSGVLNGYNMQLSQGKLLAEPTWSMNLHIESQTISNVVTKKSYEHVHSQGIVLGDRSVMYKYLNPNLIVITTEGTESSQKGGSSSYINIYLVDAVSGHIVFHCNHKRAKGPVHVVHSENWVVYNYWNQKQRRNEMAVLELYEGKKQSNATAFSSLHPPPPPIVMRQSYIFPGHIAKMASTITEKGITSKHILIAMQNGGILELPKAFLDPRRPIMPTPESREEGIMPYIPELPRPYEATVNYNQSVFNIRGIHTAPAGLESTSLVLCYGLDLFYTRVYPSKMFDVLKDDFDYLFIGSVLTGMIVVSVVTQKLAARKALNRAWK